MKMIRAVCRFVLAVLIALMCMVPARSADPARVGAYDFGYLLSGDARAKPVQVFDDGRDTYFQFRAGEPVPAIFAVPAGAPRLLVPTQEGPYVRVPQVHGRFLLQVGRAQANVVHASGERPDDPAVTAVAANGMSTPYRGTGSPGRGGRLVASLGPVAINLGAEQALDRNSYATPLRGDRVYWPERSEEAEHAFGFPRGGYVLSREARKTLAAIAARAAPAARFTVIGRDDDSYKEGLERARAEALREALVKSGIGAERITLRTGVAKLAQNGTLWDSTLIVQTPEQPLVMRRAPTPATPQATIAREPEPQVPEGGFTLSAADKTISGAVRRWAQAANYQVVWDAPAQLDAPIAGEARLPGQNIAQALDHLARGLMEKGYALEVTIYANRVIRFTAAAPDRGKPAMPPPSFATPGRPDRLAN